MRTRLYTWVALCWGAILFCAGGQLVIGGGALLFLSQQFASLWWVLGFVPVAVLGLVSVRTFQSMSLEARKLDLLWTAQSDDPVFERRRALVLRIIEGLCKIRNKKPLRVVFVDPIQRSSRLLIGLIDFLFEPDIVIMHGDSVGLVTERQLVAILSHELRHSNSPENQFRLFSPVALIASFFSSFVGALLFPVFAMFSSSVGYLDVFVFYAGAALWNLAFLGFGSVLWFAASRATEFKTDALGCADCRDHKALI